MIRFFRRIFARKDGFNESKIFNEDVVKVGEDFISPSSILLDKKLSGSFYALKDILIDTDAFITGKITSNECVIKGRIKGDIFSIRKIIIKKTAIIEGEIIAGAVEVESGAIINGCITLQQGLQAPELTKKVREAKLLGQAPEELMPAPVITPAVEEERAPLAVPVPKTEPKRTLVVPKTVGNVASEPDEEKKSTPINVHNQDSWW